MNDIAPPRAGAASTAHAAADGIRHLGDFTTGPRVLVISAIAIVVGTGGVIAGVLLLNLIRLCTNLAYFGRLTLATLPLGQSPLGVAAVVVPVIGALIVGLMARYGSDKIRGHGIPEAIEAILLGRSRLDLKVAILKPLSSAIAIGTGGPFGAEGPIIMTGGAIGSLIAQLLPVSDSERKTLLVAGAAAGMTTVFGTPIAGDHAGGRAAAVRMDAAQLRPGRRRLRSSPRSSGTWLRPALAAVPVLTAAWTPSLVGLLVLGAGRPAVGPALRAC